MSRERLKQEGLKMTAVKVSKQPTSSHRAPLSYSTVATLIIAAAIAVIACRPAPPHQLESSSGNGLDIEKVRLEAQQAQAAADQERDREALVRQALAEREQRLAEEERALQIEKQQLLERQAIAKQEEELAAREATVRERELRLEGEERQAAVEAERIRLEEERRIELEASEAADLEAERREQLAGESATVFSSEAQDPPEPINVEVTLDVGSVLEVEVQETLSSAYARVGDTFSTRAARDLYNEDGVLAIPAGTAILGQVTEARPLRRVGGQAALGLELTHVLLANGDQVAIRASFVELGDNNKKDKKKIAIAAAAGAVLGGILGHDAGGAAVGAAAGAAAGTAVVATSKSEDVEITQGQILAIRLEEVVTVTTQTGGLAPR